MGRVTIKLTDEISADLRKLACEKGISVSEVARRAFALYAIANEERSQGIELGLIRCHRDSNELVGRIVGY